MAPQSSPQAIRHAASVAVKTTITTAMQLPSQWRISRGGRPDPPPTSSSTSTSSGSGGNVNVISNVNNNKDLRQQQSFRGPAANNKAVMSPSRPTSSETMSVRRGGQRANTTNSTRPPPSSSMPSATTRLLRTEVIWDAKDDDPNEKCPINCDVLSSACGNKNRRKTVLTAILALIIVAAQHLLISMNGPVIVPAESAPLNLVANNTNNAVTIITGKTSNNDGSSNSNTMVASRHQTTMVPLLLPATIDQNLADVTEPLRPFDVPYFFHAPRTMGQTTKEIVGNCVGLNLTTALNFTSTIEGIRRAVVAANDDAKENVFDIGGADMIITQYLHAGAELFNENHGHRGRMFTFIRHPIERAVSMFHYLATATHEPTYDPDLAFISLEMWARSKRVENNWITRFLSNELEGDLTMEHLDLSKEIMRKKCLVGLFDEKAESWWRLERFFGWKLPTQKSRECLDRLLNWGWSNKNLHPMIEEGSVAWELLYKHNELDMMLYQYAQLLFEEQRALF